MGTHRLTLLAAGGSLPVPGLLRAARAQAPAPAAIAQAPGFYRFRVGGFAATTVHDGLFARPIEGFVRDAPLGDVEAVLRDAFLPTDRTALAFTITFVARGDTLVVLDAGNGVTPAAATNGKMTANMAAAGIDPARVTHVVHSHFHGDHINGLLNAAGAGPSRMPRCWSPPPNGPGGPTTSTRRAAPKASAPPSPTRHAASHPTSSA